MPRHAWIAVLCAVCILAGRTTHAAIDGYAAMGASETAGSDVNGSWVPYLVNSRGLSFGGAGNPYNVAVGGATSATLLTQGQHTSVRNQVLAGNVDLAYISIGGNDFNAVANNIASGALTGAALTAWASGVVTNINTAVDTVLSAHPTGLVVCGVPDITLTPAGRGGFNTPIRAARGVAAIDELNALLRPQAWMRGLPYVDLAAPLRDLNALPMFKVGGVTIDLVTPSGSDQTHFFADGLHPRAVGNGLIANIMMAAANMAYGTNTALLTDLEILTAAGLQAQYTGETSNVNYAKYVQLAVLGDVSFDGVVNLVDVQVVGEHWMTAGPTGDANHDGIVNLVDVQVVGQNWLRTVGSGATVAVPEPSALALVGPLLLACGVALGRSRPRRLARG